MNKEQLTKQINNFKLANKKLYRQVDDTWVYLTDAESEIKARQWIKKYYEREYVLTIEY